MSPSNTCTGLVKGQLSAPDKGYKITNMFVKKSLTGKVLCTHPYKYPVKKVSPKDPGSHLLLNHLQRLKVSNVKVVVVHTYVNSEITTFHSNKVYKTVTFYSSFPMWTYKFLKNTYSYINVLSLGLTKHPQER